MPLSISIMALIQAVSSPFIVFVQTNRNQTISDVNQNSITLLASPWKQPHFLITSSFSQMLVETLKFSSLLKPGAKTVVLLSHAIKKSHLCKPASYAVLLNGPEFEPGLSWQFWLLSIHTTVRRTTWNLPSVPKHRAPLLASLPKEPGNRRTIMDQMIPLSSQTPKIRHV